MSIDPIIIPFQDVDPGETIEYNGNKLIVDQHFSQGKDMKDLGYTHMMFSNKGAFGLTQVVEQAKEEVNS